MTAKKTTPKPCPRCLNLADEKAIRAEAVMPLPEGRGIAPQAQDGSGPCCRDCAAADTMTRIMVLDFSQARVAVANDRQENMRRPKGMRHHFGLVKQGIMRASEGDDALAKHQAWLDEVWPEWKEYSQ